MRQQTYNYKLIKCGCLFFTGDIFSDLSNEEASPALFAFSSFASASNNYPSPILLEVFIKGCIPLYSILLTFLKNYIAVMPEEKNIIDELLKRGFTKSEIHSALHKFMMEEIKRKNEDQNIFKRIQKSLRKIKWKLTKIIQLSKKQ